MTRRLFALAGCAAVLGWGQTRVLIIGDSISIGYAPFVREQLAGKAQVERIEGNGADSANILARLDTWLARGPYDAIAFNCGLHDLKYTSAHQVPPEQYEANLARIVERLRATGAKLIWVTTTSGRRRTARASQGRLRQARERRRRLQPDCNPSHATAQIAHMRSARRSCGVSGQ
ncbi:MAG: SGNH/GDSL hydrolase family protein [Candidatus Solibacter usitatus]|nr:SGNH/GDSL hydrolase family protein [Candidatus Solibacter usitatus]